VALQFQVLYRAAAARAVDQAHERQAQVAGHALHRKELVLDAAIVGAAAHGEIVAGDGHRAPVDAPAAEDQVGRREIGQRAVSAVLRDAREAADLVEGTFVQQLVYALAHRELAAVVLALDLVRPAHLFRERLAAAQFLDLFFPAHGFRV